MIGKRKTKNKWNRKKIENRAQANLNISLSPSLKIQSTDIELKNQKKITI